MNTDGKIHKSGFIDSNKVSSKHEPPEPCRTLPKPTPAEALELKIKLPWEDKVRRMRPADLTKELFVQLDEYGLTRTEIMNLFHCYQYDFYPLLKKWGIPPATPGGKKKALRSGNLEPVAPLEKPPIDLSRSYHDTAPGKARAARLAKGPEEEIDLAIRTEKELDAEMERIDKRLAELGCKPEPTQAAATDQDDDGLNYQDRHNLGIHVPTQTELEDVFRPDDEGQIDLGGWLEFQGGVSRFQSLGNRLSVSQDFYVGKDVEHIRDWVFCAIMVKPDGRQVALKKTDSGAMVNKKARCVKITCKAAIERIHALVGGPAQYVVETVRPDLVIFQLCQEAKKAG